MPTPEEVIAFLEVSFPNFKKNLSFENV